MNQSVESKEVATLYSGSILVIMCVVIMWSMSSSSQTQWNGVLSGLLLRLVELTHEQNST